MEKKIDLGKYTIKILYKEELNKLDISVFDEGGELIDVLSIEDNEEEENNKLDINLN